MALVALLFVVLLFGSFWGLVYFLRRIFNKSAVCIKDAGTHVPSVLGSAALLIEKIVKRLVFTFFFLVLALLVFAYILKSL